RGVAPRSKRLMRPFGSLSDQPAEIAGAEKRGHAKNEWSRFYVVIDLAAISAKRMLIAKGHEPTSTLHICLRAVRGWWSWRCCTRLASQFEQIIVRVQTGAPRCRRRHPSHAVDHAINRAIVVATFE